MTQHLSAKEDDWDLTGELSQVPPFTDLGFDTLANKITLSECLSLEEVTQISHMTHLGRPLYVHSNSFSSLI